MKKLIVFDLDGTLAESKSPLNEEMAALLARLLEVTRAAIISGGAWEQFRKQVLAKLPAKTNLANLAILPTCGTRYYAFEHCWKELYAENFSPAEVKLITESLQNAVEASGITFGKLWGDQIENRGSQVTFSALGQKAPLAEKLAWDPDLKKRKKISALLKKPLKNFSVNIGGSTSIDITQPGIDKAYGIHKLEHILKINISEMIFIGDALFEGGNDQPARTTGVDCIRVRDPEDTCYVIEGIIYCLKA